MEAGIAFSMTMAILLAFYRTTEPYKKRRVLLGTILAGFVAAGISAYIRSIPNYVNRTQLSFYSMIPVVIGLIGLLVLIACEQKLRERHSSAYETIFSIFLIVYVVGSFFYSMPEVFLQLNSFVYYGESAVSTMVLMRIIGYVLALFLLFFSSFAIYKTATRLHPKHLKRSVTTTLILQGIVQVTVILQRLYSLHIIPRSKGIFAAIAWVLNHDHYFSFAVMVFLMTVPLILWRNNVKITEPYKNNAELRKIKAHMRLNRRWAMFLIVLIAMDFLSLTALKSYNNRETALSPPEEYEMENGMIVVPLDNLEDGHLHRYIYKAKDGVNVRFFLIKKAENSYGVVLDACDICGPSGYFERKDEVICKLCDVVMNRGTIGFKGGCNPIPFPYKIHDRKVKIDPKDLDALSDVFRNESQ